MQRKALVTGFFHVFLVFLMFAHGVARQGFTPLWLSGVLLRGQAAFCRSTHQPVDVRVVFTFWLLQVTLTCYHSGRIACEVRVDVFSLLWVHTQEWGCWPTWPLHVQPEKLPDCPPPRLHHFTSPPPQRVPTPGASHRSPQWTLSKCTDRGMEVSSHLPLLQWLRTCSSRKRVKTRACRGVGWGWHGATWVLGASSHRPAWGAQASYFPRGGQLWGEVGSTWSHQETPLRLTDAKLPAPWPQWGPVTPGDACRCAGRGGAGRGLARPGVEPGKLH